MSRFIMCDWDFDVLPVVPGSSWHFRFSNGPMEFWALVAHGNDHEAGSLYLLLLFSEMILLGRD